MHLLKFAYDGLLFQGYSRQEGKITVEGEIINTMERFGLKAVLKSSSRTDRGVSALGNVIGIKSERNLKDIIGILKNARNLYFYAYAEVDDSFNPRHANERWYRYMTPYEYQEIEKIREKANIFIGEHDFSLFSRRDGRNTLRRINSIEVKIQNDFLVFDIKGESFLWNMVRRVVGYLLYGKGDPFVEGGKYNVPPAGLILMDVSYNFSFTRLEIYKKKLDIIYQEIGTRNFLYESLRRISEGRWGIEPQ